MVLEQVFGQVGHHVRVLLYQGHALFIFSIQNALTLHIFLEKNVHQPGELGFDAVQFGLQLNLEVFIPDLTSLPLQQQFIEQRHCVRRGHFNSLIELVEYSLQLLLSQLLRQIAGDTQIKHHCLVVEHRRLQSLFVIKVCNFHSWWVLR